jgi:hypothetical protein
VVMTYVTFDLGPLFVPYNIPSTTKRLPTTLL